MGWRQFGGNLRYRDGLSRVAHLRIERATEPARESTMEIGIRRVFADSFTHEADSSGKRCSSFLNLPAMVEIISQNAPRRGEFSNIGWVVREIVDKPLEDGDGLPKRFLRFFPVAEYLMNPACVDPRGSFLQPRTRFGI
jgi:hypothetical protein